MRQRTVPALERVRTTVQRLLEPTGREAVARLRILLRVESGMVGIQLEGDVIIQLRVEFLLEDAIYREDQQRGNEGEEEGALLLCR